MTMDCKVIKSIIWDWNGTILNDVDNNINAVNTILQKGNLSVISKEEYRKKIKIPIKQFYNDIGLNTNDPETYSLITNDYWEYYNMGYKNNTKINDGIENILNKLKENNINNYLLSATQHDELIKQVKDKGMEIYFKDIIGNNNYEVKSKLEKAQELIKNENMKITNTILVGDMINDYELAEELGIKCILYSNGHQEIKIENDKNIINNFEEIYNYIKIH
jgi:phosphoglycolate phosphatase